MFQAACLAHHRFVYLNTWSPRSAILFLFNSWFFIIKVYFYLPLIYFCTSTSLIIVNPFASIFVIIINFCLNNRFVSYLSYNKLETRTKNTYNSKNQSKGKDIVKKPSCSFSWIFKWESSIIGKTHFRDNF